jgi:hypothetical protein
MCGDPPAHFAGCGTRTRRPRKAPGLTWWGRRGRAPPGRDALARGGARRGRGSAARPLAPGPGPPAAQRRLRPRRRHHGRQLLRPRPRRGLRIRGADLLPRRPRRPQTPRSSSTPGIALPRERIIGAAAVHDTLAGWRMMCKRLPTTTSKARPRDPFARRRPDGTSTNECHADRHRHELEVIDALCGELSAREAKPLMEVRGVSCRPDSGACVSDSSLRQLLQQRLDPL